MGLEKEAALGKKLEEIVPGIESEERYLLFKKVLETGEPIHIETYQPVEKFGDLWVSVWAFKSGNNLGLISRDITSQKVAEERFRRSKQFEAVSSIGATIAHDLRNPLSRTNQAIELARRKPNTTERMLDLAQESAQYALNMVEEFREGTRWIKPKKQKVNLKKLVSESIGSVKMPDRVKLTVDMAASVGMVMVDPEVLQRVIVNLVLNGIEAMPYGGWLNISINRRDSFVSIAVSDTGVGMSHEVLKKIWQPLFTTKSKGIGLGLYFVRNAIDAHGGDINITTEPGKGTTFTINIPDSIE